MPASVDTLRSGRGSVACSGSLVGPDGSSRRRAAMLRLIRASASSKRLVAGSSTDSSGAGACGRAGASSAGIWSGAGAAFWSGAGAVFCAVVGDGTPVASSMSQFGSVVSSIARLGDEF